MTQGTSSRREFLSHSSKIATAFTLAIGTTVRPVLGANDRLRLGFIGVGNRGSQLLHSFMKHDDVEVAALCDVYQPYLARDRSQVAPQLLKALGGRIPTMGEKLLSGGRTRHRFPSTPGPQGHRRGRDRHARSLARHPGDCSHGGGERCLRGEALIDHDPRRSKNGPGGTTHRARGAGWASPAVLENVPQRAWPDPIWKDRQSHRRAGLPHQ